MTSRREQVVTLSCADRPGIVHAVAAYLVQHGVNIVQSSQYGDREAGRFFMRVHVESDSPETTTESLRAGFDEAVAGPWGMQWGLWDINTPTRTLVMVSRAGHCLNDLLYRWRTGGLHVDIPAIVSNHRDLEPLAAAYAVPFHHIEVSLQTREQAEDRLLRLVDDLGIDLVVLARYMQVLSDGACAALDGRAINIHHSFLPSFKGARPYHQAYERGVKLIGATAHYVTADLDDGPIIEQDVVRVDHAMSAEELARAGHEVESRVLSRAVGWHAEHRVMRNGNRTVVFR